nr:MAG TPA: hypothetical protein [Caudoviricetes sp.]
MGIKIAPTAYCYACLLTNIKFCCTGATWYKNNSSIAVYSI